ncbi:exonuclease domain-containing protein [Neisseriaceae bacterium ESL0693]|nr:exonuclease domain-containing protein [Neisseriaceae bacterium ESL0693]
MGLTTDRDTTSLAPLAMVLAQLPLPVAVVDLETTGGHFEDDRITEIAILRFDRGRISRHQWLINPQKQISSFIVGLTGISNEMVEHAPTFDVIAPELLPLLRGHLLVAHNSRFDYTFLRYAFARNNLAFAAPTLDTVSLSRRLYSEFFKHNLDSIIERFKIDIDANERHRASGDVLALSQFLALSLAEKTAEPWFKQWRALVKPAYLTSKVSVPLREQIYALPDEAGISVWRHTETAPAEIYVHAQAFSEIMAKLSKKVSAQSGLEPPASMTFMPAKSQLHAYFLLGQQRQQNNIDVVDIDHQNAAKSRQHWYTIQFRLNQRGQLQPHIKPLHEGILTQRPYGLFLHRQAAKRALAQWAREHQLCPAVLDIMPQSLKASEPCPRQAINECDGHCKSDDATSLHNQRVLKYAHLLPVTDWGNRHELILTERHKFSHQYIQLRMQSGCLQLDERHWYFHPNLPKLLKQRLKHPDDVEVVA